MWSVAPLLLAPVVALYGPSVGVNGTLHVQTHDALYALDKKGALLWRFEVPCFRQGYGCLAQHLEGVNGTVYLAVRGGANYSGSLIALDGSDGVMKWNYTVAGLVYQEDMEVGVDGTVYLKICSYQSEDPHCKRTQTAAVSSDGSLKWSLETSNPWFFFTEYSFQAATQGVDGTVFLNGPEERSLCAVWPEDGTVKWHQQYLSQIGIAPHQTVVDKDGTVFALSLPDSPFGCGGTSLMMALSGEDGSVLWEVAFNLTDSPEMSNFAAEMVNGEEFIYVHYVDTSNSCRLRAYHHRSGKEAWAKQWQCGAVHPSGQGSFGRFSVANLVQPDGTVVESLVMGAGASDQVLALDGRDGSELWRMVGLDGLSKTGTTIDAPVVAEDGTVIVIDDYTLPPFYGDHVVAIRGGQMAWQFHLTNTTEFGSIRLDVMTSDGVTYIQSSDRYESSVYWYVVAVSSQGIPQWTFSGLPKIIV